METRFGADFGQVRVHTGSDAVQMNRDVQAQAFTHGRSIYFGAGRYDPSSTPGRRLLAHELTHVVQQGAAGPGPRRKPDAEQTDAPVRRQPDPSARTASSVIQRDDDLLEQTTTQTSPPTTVAPTGTIPTTTSTVPPKSTPTTSVPTQAPEEAPETPVTMSGITVNPATVVADGASTVQVTAGINPSSRPLNWTIPGTNYGSTVSDTGLVTAGTDTQGKKEVMLHVKAADAAKPEVSMIGDITLVHPDYVAYKAFVAGGPYRKANHTVGVNGKFDMDYDPAGKTATVGVKVKFDWPPATAPAPEDQLLATDPLARTAYKTKYIEMIQTGFNSKQTVENKREPLDVWSALNPIKIRVAVSEVDSGQHFVVRPRKANQGRASVGMASGAAPTDARHVNIGHDLNPATWGTAPVTKGETDRVQSIINSVDFAADKATIPGPASIQLSNLANYLKRINNPKFTLTLTASAHSGGTAEEDLKLAAKRADKVKTLLSVAGLTNHTITVVNKGQGASGNKVTVVPTVDSGFVHAQDVTLHEFGHMMGLDDEYVYANDLTRGSGTKVSHHALLRNSLGDDYADRVGTRDAATDYRQSLMQSGGDVRVEHYVTMWDALVQAAAMAAKPTTKFTHAEWKLIG